MSNDPRRNIEIKARLTSLDAARQIAASLATKHLGVFEQVDTFFHCSSGRLKVRQVKGQPAELIAYHRPDTSEAKTSNYHLIRIDEGGQLIAALSSSLGKLQTVRKVREVFLYHNVRIHLDHVENLGDFLELESVVSGDVTESTARQRLDELVARFSIQKEDLKARAYADLLSEAR